MAKDPGDRYASAAALAADVQHWLADEPVSAWREPWTIRARRWVVRHRTAVAAGVAALGVAVVGLAAALAIQSQSNRDLQAALKSERLAQEDAIAPIESGRGGHRVVLQGDQSKTSSSAGRSSTNYEAGCWAPPCSFYEKRVNYLTDKHQGGGEMVRVHRRRPRSHRVTPGHARRPGFGHPNASPADRALRREPRAWPGRGGRSLAQPRRTRAPRRPARRTPCGRSGRP